MSRDAVRSALTRARDRLVFETLLAVDKHGPDLPRNLTKAATEYRRVWSEWLEAVAVGPEKIAKKSFDFSEVE